MKIINHLDVNDKCQHKLELSCAKLRKDTRLLLSMALAWKSYTLKFELKSLLVWIGRWWIKQK